LPALTAHLAGDAPPRLAGFLHSCGARIADFANAPGFDNLNTPEDLTRAEMRHP
jgi:molybdopterin-guanine dinucleotide biosynthesis protein A